MMQQQAAEIAFDEERRARARGRKDAAKTPHISDDDDDVDDAERNSSNDEASTEGQKLKSSSSKKKKKSSKKKKSKKKSSKDKDRLREGDSDSDSAKARSRKTKSKSRSSKSKSSRSKDHKSKRRSKSRECDGEGFQGLEEKSKEYSGDIAEGTEEDLDKHLHNEAGKQKNSHLEGELLEDDDSDEEVEVEEVVETVEKDDEADHDSETKEQGDDLEERMLSSRASSLSSSPSSLSSSAAARAAWASKGTGSSLRAHSKSAARLAKAHHSDLVVEELAGAQLAVSVEDEEMELAPVQRGYVDEDHIVRKHVLQRGYMQRLTDHGLSRELTGSSPWVKRYFGLRVLVSQDPEDGTLTAHLELAYAKDEDEFVEGDITKSVGIEKSNTVIRLGFGRKSTMWIKTGKVCWTLRTKDVDTAMFWALGIQSVSGVQVETSTRLVWPYPNLRVAPSLDLWLEKDTKMRRLRGRSLTSPQGNVVELGALHGPTEILFRKNFLHGNVSRLKHHLSLGSAWVKRFFSLDMLVGRESDGVVTVQVELTYSETELDHAYNHVSRGMVIDNTVELELACTIGPVLYLRKMGHKTWVLKFEKVRQAMYWTAGLHKVTGARLESFKPVQWPYGSVKEPLSVNAWLETEEAAEVLSAEGRLVDVISHD